MIKFCFQELIGPKYEIKMWEWGCSHCLSQGANMPKDELEGVSG